jgi:hypothetical protein
MKTYRGRVNNALGRFVLCTRWRRVGEELDSMAAFTREAVGINFMVGLL